METIKQGSDIIRFAFCKGGLDYGKKNGWVKAETPVRRLWGCPGERKQVVGLGHKGDHREKGKMLCNHKVVIEARLGARANIRGLVQEEGGYNFRQWLKGCSEIWRSL